MALVSKSNTFSAGTTAKSAEVNSDFDTIYNDYNGNITNANVSASASISASKLNLSGIAQTVSYTGAPENWAKGSDIASATSTAIGAATGNYINVTGTTTITSFDTVQSGTVRFVQFTGALTLTHNATSLILPSGANITTAAGDTAIFASEGSGNWRCLNYSLKTGGALAGSSVSGSVIQTVNVQYTTAGSSATTIPYDNTIPQISEGAEVTTLAITPASASNKLFIIVTSHVSSTVATNPAIVSLFQDASANALTSGAHYIPSVSSADTVVITHFMTAGTTSSTTFRLRVGMSSNTVYWNRDDGSATRLGGSFTTSITIMEIKA